LVIVAPLGRVGPWLPPVDLKLRRLREKITFSLLRWLLITMMILAIVTRDPAQQGVPVATWSPFGFGPIHPLAPERFGEAKLAVLLGLGVAATMISWTILW
jgi:hypothetical protein